MGALLLTSLLAAGCQAVPSTYAEWKREQAERARCEAAGIPYKSPSELRKEAAEMRHLADETEFKTAPH